MTCQRDDRTLSRQHPDEGTVEDSMDVVSDSDTVDDGDSDRGQDIDMDIVDRAVRGINHGALLIEHGRFVQAVPPLLQVMEMSRALTSVLPDGELSFSDLNECLDYHLVQSLLRSGASLSSIGVLRQLHRGRSFVSELPIHHPIRICDAPSYRNSRARNKLFGDNENSRERTAAVHGYHPKLSPSLISIIAIYNLALAFHLIAIEQGRTGRTDGPRNEFLQKAASLYESILSVPFDGHMSATATATALVSSLSTPSQDARTTGTDTASDRSIPLFWMLIINNRGHIHYAYHDEGNTKRCFELILRWGLSYNAAVIRRDSVTNTDAGGFGQSRLQQRYDGSEGNRQRSHRQFRGRSTAVSPTAPLSPRYARGYAETLVCEILVDRFLQNALCACSIHSDGSSAAAA